MTIFTVVITRETSPGSFTTKLASDFAGNHISIIPNVWLVSGRGSAKELSDQLGISEAVTATGVVTTVGSYYGRATTNIWDWVKAKIEETE